ncbi:MAG: hypothetical protein ACLP7P_08615 [Rhodomicrobium sp.]
MNHVDELKQQIEDLKNRRGKVEFPADTDKPPQLPAGASASQARAVQQWLLSHGWYGDSSRGKSPVDSNPGGETGKALARAQVDYERKLTAAKKEQADIDGQIANIQNVLLPRAKTDEYNATTLGRVENALATAGPYAAGLGLGGAEGVGARELYKRGVDYRADYLNSAAKPLADIDYRSPAALAQAEGAVATARPYMTPQNPIANALARGAGFGGRAAMFSVLPGIELYKASVYKDIADDPTKSDAERADARMLSNFLLASGGMGGFTGAFSTFLPYQRNTAEDETRLRTAAAMLQSPLGGTLPGPVVPSGTPAIAQATPANAFVRDPNAVDVTPEPATAQAVPMPAEPIAAKDPNFQQYLAEQEASLRARIATGQPGASPAQATPQINGLAPQPPAQPQPAPQPSMPQLPPQQVPANNLAPPPSQQPLPPDQMQPGEDPAAYLRRNGYGIENVPPDVIRQRAYELDSAKKAQLAASPQEANSNSLIQQAAPPPAASPASNAAAGLADDAAIAASRAVPRSRTAWKGVYENSVRNSSEDELRARLGKAGFDTAGDKETLIKRVMGAKLALPIALATGAGMALAGSSSPAEAASPGDEGVRLPPGSGAFVRNAADAATYGVPYVGEARTVADLGRAALGAYNPSDEESADAEYWAKGAQEMAPQKGPSTFEEAMDALRSALRKHRLLSAPPPSPANNLVRP